MRMFFLYSPSLPLSLRVCVSTLELICESRLFEIKMLCDKTNISQAKSHSSVETERCRLGYNMQSSNKHRLFTVSNQSPRKIREY